MIVPSSIARSDLGQHMPDSALWIQPPDLEKGTKPEANPFREEEKTDLGEVGL